jgi:hypothetical protein
MKNISLDHLFAAAQRASAEEFTDIPAGFAERIVQQYQKQRLENQRVLRVSIVSIGIAFVILSMVFGYNFEVLSYSGIDDQESTVELPSTLWDPIGN